MLSRFKKTNSNLALLCCSVFCITEQLLLLFFSFRGILFSSTVTSNVHNQTPVFSRGCLLPHIGRTDVQWSQIKLSGSEPCVIRSSRGLFPVSQGIVIHSSNSTVMVFIGSTASNVNKESEAAHHYHAATFAQ